MRKTLDNVMAVAPWWLLAIALHAFVLLLATLIEERCEVRDPSEEPGGVMGPIDWHLVILSCESPAWSRLARPDTEGPGDVDSGSDETSRDYVYV